MLSIEETKAIVWAILGIGFAITLVVSLIVAHFSNKYNNFSLIDLLIDNKTKKISGSKFRLNGAFFVTSWILIWITLKVTTVTSDFVLLYAAFLTAWVTDRINSRSKLLTDLEGSDKREDEELGEGSYSPTVKKR